MHVPSLLNNVYVDVLIRVYGSSETESRKAVRIFLLPFSWSNRADAKVQQTR
jgi:hypothetical protein